eukprot:m.104749 g.104749  ORF g.104749 m.104749 type:complete len:119 (-) comp51613_c0_seq1:45-401(-)
MGELLNKAPLMPGKTELDQFDLISRLIGSPSDAIWPGFSSMPLASKLTLPNRPYNNISSMFSFLSSSGIDLLNLLLTYDPSLRLTARETLRHSYFRTAPLPISTDLMPTFPQHRNSRK